MAHSLILLSFYLVQWSSLWGPLYKANRWIHCLHPILNRTLADLGERPARKMADVAFDLHEDALYFHDGTERPIQRPGDPEKQRDYYSGKKNTR